MPNIPAGEYWTSSEAAEQLGVSHPLIRAACNAGEIEGAIRLDARSQHGAWIVPMEAAQAWNQRRLEQPRGRPRSQPS